jgi:hypothetical protein
MMDMIQRMYDVMDMIQRMYDVDRIRVEKVTTASQGKLSNLWI